jgi:glycosyltransferase involved in cell wall biosynthesis
MKLSLIIPIYNEAELLETVLKNVRAAIPCEHELVLVDDHSTDGTIEILKREEKKEDTTVVYHEKNMGKGAGIRSGLAHAHGDIIIVQDADMEYDPYDIPRVIQPIIDGKCNVAYGSRFMGSVKNMRFPNYVANQILAWMVSILYFHRITDEATAYKAFRKDVIKSITLECNRFEFCPEVTAKILRKGEKIIEVPIKFNARSFEEGKKIGWRDFVVAVWTLLKFRFVK